MRCIHPKNSKLGRRVGIGTDNDTSCPPLWVADRVASELRCPCAASCVFFPTADRRDGTCASVSCSAPGLRPEPGLDGWGSCGAAAGPRRGVKSLSAGTGTRRPRLKPGWREERRPRLGFPDQDCRFGAMLMHCIFTELYQLPIHSGKIPRDHTTIHSRSRAAALLDGLPCRSNRQEQKRPRLVPKAQIDRPIDPSRNHHFGRRHLPFFFPTSHTQSRPAPCVQQQHYRLSICYFDC